MALENPKIPIEVLHLFPKLDELLLELLIYLTTAEWELPTIAKLWKVKDVAAHLLDGNLRTLSFSRDNHFDEKPANISSYGDLIAYLNQLNATWVNAAKRLSPRVLISLLEGTGKEFSAHLNTLQPFEPAIFPVAWAGQNVSDNWFHIAREYTEKFIHQQQIREAVNKQALFTKELFYPLIDTFMYALPHTYKNVAADLGTIIRMIITTNIGGEWHIIKKENDWELIKTIPHEPASTILIEPNIAWKLFSKGMTPQQALEKVKITGDKKLGEIALQMVSVMA